jgi:hypothetical protein
MEQLLKPHRLRADDDIVVVLSNLRGRAMRTFRVLVLAALAAGSLALMAPGASATAPAASTASFCKAVAGISKNLGDDPSKGGEPSKIASQLRKAAKSAPSKVKSALETMAGYFDAVSDAGSNPSKVASTLQKNAAKYGKAVATFTSYYAKNCSGVS